MNRYAAAIFVYLYLLGYMLSAQQNIAETIAPYKYETQYLKVADSINLAFVDEGKGEKTLIFIHGLATYLPSWYPVFDQFKSEYRCIAVDLPGYGRSSKAEYPCTMDFYADVLLELTERLNLKNPVLVGHSMGAQIAVTAVLKKPELFEELVLLAPAGFETFKPEQADWLKQVSTIDFVCNATDEQVRTNWQLNFFDMPESVEFMIQDRLKMKNAIDFRLYGRSIVQSIHGMLDQPIFYDLKNLKTRTLVVYGQNDLLIPNRYLNKEWTTESVAKSGTAQIQNGQLKFIQDCGHFIMFDQPEEVNQLLKTFLNE